MKNFNSFFLIVFFLIFIGCKENSKTEISHRKGELTIAVDYDSQSLAEALSRIYMQRYPDAKIKLIPKSENEILNDLMNHKENAAIVSFELNKEQSEHIFNSTTLRVINTQIAYDAVVFIANANNSIKSISLNEIKEYIKSENPKLVFGNANSGNFNTVKKRLNLNEEDFSSVISLENSEKVVEFIESNPSVIGAVGLNMFSEEDSPRVKSLLERVKIISVEDKENNVIYPSVDNLKNFTYPFYKEVYLVFYEPGFGIGNGLARFCGSKEGQLIVEREGLQPHYLYERNVMITTNPMEP